MMIETARFNLNFESRPNFPPDLDFAAVSTGNIPGQTACNLLGLVTS